MEIITEESKLFSENFTILESVEMKLQKIKKSTPLSENWLTIKQACEYLKMSPKTLLKYRDDAEVGSTKQGNKIYFKESDLLEMLERNYKPLEKKSFPTTT